MHSYLDNLKLHVWMLFISWKFCTFIQYLLFFSSFRCAVHFFLKIEKGVFLKNNRKFRTKINISMIYVINVIRIWTIQMITNWQKPHISDESYTRVHFKLSNQSKYTQFHSFLQNDFKYYDRDFKAVQFFFVVITYFQITSDIDNSERNIEFLLRKFAICFVQSDDYNFIYVS